MKWTKTIKANMWAKMVKDNIQDVRDRELTKKANIVIFGLAYVVTMLVVLVLLLKGVIL